MNIQVPNTYIYNNHHLKPWDTPTTETRPYTRVELNEKPYKVILDSYPNKPIPKDLL